MKMVALGSGFGSGFGSGLGSGFRFWLRLGLHQRRHRPMAGRGDIARRIGSFDTQAVPRARRQAGHPIARASRTAQHLATCVDLIARDPHIIAGGIPAQVHRGFRHVDGRQIARRRRRLGITWRGRGHRHAITGGRHIPGRILRFDTETIGRRARQASGPIARAGGAAQHPAAGVDLIARDPHIIARGGPAQRGRRLGHSRRSQISWCRRGVGVRWGRAINLEIPLLIEPPMTAKLNDVVPMKIPTTIIGHEFNFRGVSMR